MEENIEFAKIIKLIREKYHLSQDELAYRCGVQTSYISKIERGAHKPNLVTINKMALALDMSRSQLLLIDENFLSVPDFDPITFKAIGVLKSLSEDERLQAYKILLTFKEKNKKQKIEE